MNDGGPAFPADWKDFQPTTGEQVVREQFPGMSLRDYFASAALTGFCQHQGWVGYLEHPEHRKHLFTNYAEDAYAFADAMLAVREKNQSKTENRDSKIAS